MDIATDHIKFIVHNGKPIIFQDLRGITDVNIGIETFKKTQELIVMKPEKSVRLLTDVTDADYNREGIDVMREFAKVVTPYILASAAVGVVGLKLFVLKTMIAVSRRNIASFTKLEEAMDWLALQ